MPTPASSPIEIEIEILPDGTIKSVVKGVAGPDCDGLTKWLDELGDCVSDEKTPDYYKTVSVKAGVKAGRK